MKLTLKKLPKIDPVIKLLPIIKLIGNFIVSAIDMSHEKNIYAEESGSIDTLILDLNDNSITSVFHMKENGKPYYYATFTGKCY